MYLRALHLVLFALYPRRLLYLLHKSSCHEPHCQPDSFHSTSDPVISDSLSEAEDLIVVHLNTEVAFYLVSMPLDSFMSAWTTSHPYCQSL